MTISLGSPIVSTPLKAAPNFRSWQRDTVERGLLPVIGVAGGRGKSTVVRMLDAILRKAHLRTATWTNLGIDIRGNRQRGEISGWSLALSRLSESSIDVAIQELDWSTINAVGLPLSSYPLLAVTNLAGSLDAPLGEDLTFTARRGAHRVAGAVHANGVLVVNGDDPALIESANTADCALAVTSLSHESPNLRQHFEQGGSGVWIDGSEIRSGDFDNVRSLCVETEIPSSLAGAAQFELANALTAIAIASCIGVDDDTIVRTICEFETSADILPGSFNVYAVNDHRIVVDGVAPSWHLRPLLRAVNPGNRRRQISVVGNLDRLPEHDLPEIGRLLGRHLGAIVLHSNSRQDLMARLIRGIAANNFPPVVIHLPTERRALNRALKTARADDLVLILTGDDPGPSIRAVGRLFFPA
ncbi:MAG: hypothetical protein M3490_05575 [Chloroflexota bacterium]|nr:hypothetical protein [Chloroflexota bacterium]